METNINNGLKMTELPSLTSIRTNKCCTNFKEGNEEEGDRQKYSCLKEKDSVIIVDSSERCEQLEQEKLDNLFVYNDILTSYVWNHQMDIRGLKGALRLVTKKWCKESARANNLSKENMTLKIEVEEVKHLYMDAKAENEILREQLEALGGVKKSRKHGLWRSVLGIKK